MTTPSVSGGRPVERPSSPPTRPHSDHMLVELIDRILDKGLVIDAWARVSVLGIELITIEARIVVASLETYLRYAEAITAVPLVAKPPPQPERRAETPAGHQPLPQLPQPPSMPTSQAQARPQRSHPQRSHPQAPPQPTSTPAPQSQPSQSQPPQQGGERA